MAFDMSRGTNDLQLFEANNSASIAISKILQIDANL